MRRQAHAAVISTHWQSRRLSKHRRMDMSRGDGRLLPEAPGTMTRLRAELEEPPGLLNQADMEMEMEMEMSRRSSKRCS